MLQRHDTCRPSAFTSNSRLVYQPSDRVLLVEDEKMAKVLVAHTLQDYRLVTDVAENYKQVKKLLAKYRYCLVLMDIDLPVESGFHITQKLRQLPEMAGVPIVGLTAYVSSHYHERAKKVGMHASYAKPLRRDMANEIIAKFVPAHYIPVLMSRLSQVRAVQACEGQAA